MTKFLLNSGPAFCYYENEEYIWITIIIKNAKIAKLTNEKIVIE